MASPASTSRTKIAAAAARIGRLADRAADDNVIGTCRDCLPGADNARLVARGTARQPDSRRHDRHVWPENGTQGCNLEARSHHAIATRLTCESGAVDDEISRRVFDPLLREVAGIEVGEHRDAQNLEARACLSGYGRTQGLAVHGVHREKGGAGCGGGVHRPRDRVLDVEQLHVEEDLLALAGQLARKVEAARQHQLETDLVEADGRAQPS